MVSRRPFRCDEIIAEHDDEAAVARTFRDDERRLVPWRQHQLHTHCKPFIQRGDVVMPGGFQLGNAGVYLRLRR